MREQGHGRRLNISSVAASMMAGPYMAIYFASKAFVRSLSEAVSYELRDTGVSVTCVCPGPTSTGFAKAANMHGMNFFTLTKPATAYQLATYAYRKMKQGRTLAPACCASASSSKRCSSCNGTGHQRWSTQRPRLHSRENHSGGNSTSFPCG